MNDTGEFVVGLATLVVVGVCLTLRGRSRLVEWPRLLALTHLGATAVMGLFAALSLSLFGEVDRLSIHRCLWAIIFARLVWTGIRPFLERRRKLAQGADGMEVDTEPEEQLLGTLFSLWEWLLLLAVVVGLGTAAARVILLPLDWDGWAIWQLKAHGLVQGDLHRQLTAWEYQFSHPDYPLLVPTHTFWLTGTTFDPKVAQWGGLLFLLDLLGLFYTEARRLAGRTLALAGCVVLLSWALTMKHAASGFADIPMAAYAFAALTSLVRGDLWALSLALVGAVLTKNEGLFTLVGVLAALPFAARYWPGEAGSRRWAWLHGLGAAVPAFLTVAAWSVVKRRWGLFSDLLDPTQWARDPLALLPGRLLTILRGYAAQAVAVGPWYPGWGLLWPAAAWSFVETVRHRRWWVLPLWLLVGAHFAGAAVAYLVTAADAGLHLSRSLDRLWLHVAPVALLAVLVSLVGPDAPNDERKGRE